MAANEEEPMKLPQMFDIIWELYSFLEETDEPTPSTKVQEKVKQGIENSEKAIHMINQLNLFSTNEDLEEVASNELRFMLVPSLLAFFTSRQVNEDRLQTLKKDQEYLIDFLKLCKLYRVKEFAMPNVSNETADGDSGQVAPFKSGPPGQAELRAMAEQRQEKIQRFKEQKKMKERLIELREYIKQEHVEDEVKREYWLTMLKQHIMSALEEIQSIQDELPLLHHMAKMKISGASANPSGDSSSKEQPKRKPMRPFILTKADIQKTVFGAGYSSLPTYTVEEFYDEQVRLGNFPDPSQQQQVVQGYVDGPSDEAAQQDEEAAKKEKNEETDDPETLQKARDWDEWTDDHRRGWGNTDNKG